MKSLRKITLSLILFSITGLFLSGQDTVRFDDALIIQAGINYGRTAIQYDPIAYRILNDRMDNPERGKKFDLEGDNDPEWESVEIGENGYFNSSKLRGGYLYLDYNSDEEKVMILHATGHTMAFINGIPREGDHYNFSYSQIPVKLHKGMNRFFFTGGRFPMIKVLLVETRAKAILSDKDLTLPDLIIGENDNKWGAVRVINPSEEDISNHVIECRVNGGDAVRTEIPSISQMNVRKVGFLIHDGESYTEGKVGVHLDLINSRNGKVVDQLDFEIENKTGDQMYARTFISSIDGSVQYFAVRPGNIPPGEKPALFLSVHGAGVEARNQARTYKPKSWGIVVAPTNRRPFGFAWEDWGRLDALEVLEIGKKMYSTDPSRTYLTGHSMGGHGTWYLGATYPDKFAAIAPCAGYADLLGYAVRESADEKPSQIEKMFIRAANPHRTRKLARNYLHLGVYVLHGDADQTVPVSQARKMRELLGTYHNDFTYYEYPGGSHWYGDISMDWMPIFDYFKLHTIKKTAEMQHIEFHTASPGVSSSSGWLTIYNQISPFEFSSVDMHWDPERSGLEGSTTNVSLLALNIGTLEIDEAFTVSIDGQILKDIVPEQDKIWLRKEGEKWKVTGKPDKKNRGPHRYGNFKDAFRNEMVFVYGSGGTAEENQWMYYKARFDAETFGYRGNGSVEIVKDKDFSPEKYPDRNVIIYGNSSNNQAWEKLITDCPIKVRNGKVTIEQREFRGEDLGIYFVYPRRDSEVASIGVVAGTGLTGMKATYANQYFLAGPGFPDVTLFRFSILLDRYESVVCTGFFSDKWEVQHEGFIWKE